MLRKLKRCIERKVREMYAHRAKQLRIQSEYQNIRNKQALCDKVTLTPEQKEQIDCFFLEHYGKTVPHHWHRLYQSYTGVFCKDYFPEILLSTELEGLLNDRAICALLGDKNLLDVLFGGVKEVHIPTTLLSCVSGVYRDEEKNVCAFEALVQKLGNLGPCVIKKTKDTDSGRDVMICNFSHGKEQRSGEFAADVINQFGKDFVVQELVQQSDALATLNNSSVNTFRVISYICDDQLHICPIALRLGRNGADKDNIHYGGISIGVKPDGTLRKQAFTEYGEAYAAHPDSKVVFEGYFIPSANRLGETAKRLHACVPWLKIISWDLTIDSDETITLIEMNTVGQSAWFPQMVNGESLFGENTAAMLERIRAK